MLARYMKSLQVFIVLDDIDHEDQLNALLPVSDSLGWGSIIVVTSRESGVLTKWGISSIYKMKTLNPEYCKQLLCWHAFLQPSPMCGFEDLVEKFMNVCRGLPLSLKIIGELLKGKPKEYWNSLLNKVSRSLPKDLKGILSVSFKELDEEEQEIFLDIACFFIGEQKSLAIAVWDASGWSGVYSWEILENKCLVEVDERNRITMHDHLRDLGKEIAETKPPYRLYSPRQITNIQQQQQKIALVRGIKGETDEFYRPQPFQPPSYDSIELVGGSCTNSSNTPFHDCIELVRGSGTPPSLGLKILAAKDGHFTEELSALSTGLVWLRWDNLLQRALPSWLSLNNLRVLDLSHSLEMEQLWSDNAHPPLELRELNMGNIRNFLRFPRSIGRLKELKKISLNDFRCGVSCQVPITSLPEEFCDLQSLEHLELRGCHKLTSLPTNFGYLTNLRYLDLSGCLQLEELPASFKELINLQYLNLVGCTKLTFSPEILKNMTKLETVHFMGCMTLRDFTGSLLRK
ncbi:hypothetical protein SUGI_0409510 [Cryptomeria japonica]|nr:hypothetical protein SUGI_0409510 [Cryptomeria japonica]